MATSPATRARADGREQVRALRDAKVTFNDTKTAHSILPYSEPHSQHSPLIVATDTGFKDVKAHADRYTGKYVAVMDARRRDCVTGRL